MGVYVGAAHITGMSNPTRAPAGTPEGGRFAPGRRAETGVTLNPASEEPGQVDPAILGEMQRRRVAVEEAELAYELVCARGLADIVSQRWPQAHALEMEPWEDDPDHLVVTGVYSSGEGGRLPVTDAAIHDFNFDDQDVFAMTSALAPARRPGHRGQPGEPTGSAYMSGDSKLLGQTFDVDKALSLRVTTREVDDERERCARRDISGAVFTQFPDATSWSVGTREYEDGYSYSVDEVGVTKVDGSVDYLDRALPSVTPKTLGVLRDAIGELNDLDGQLGAYSTHDHDIGRPE